MRAIEFITKMQKGSIKVPARYAERLKKEFRVIILVDDEPQKVAVKRALKAFRVKTSEKFK